MPLRKQREIALQSIEYEKGVHFTNSPNENRFRSCLPNGVARFAPLIIAATVYSCGRRGDRRGTGARPPRRHAASAVKSLACFNLGIQPESVSFAYIQERH